MWSFMNMPKRLPAFLGGIEVHQTTVGENLSLIGRQVLEIEMDVLDTIGADHLGVNLLLARKDGLADAGNIDEIAGDIFKRSLL